jgi:phage terminase large subunit
MTEPTKSKPRRSRKSTLASDSILTGDPSDAPSAPVALVASDAGAPIAEPEQGESLRVPAPLLPLFTSTVRNIVIPGGRASGKSHAVATYLLLRAREKWERILCCRETQTSIAASNKQLIEDKIKSLGLSDEFNVLGDSITHKTTGSEFIFSGLRDGGARIRSLEGATIAHVEEAQQISKKSLETLIPTIRAPGSQLIFTLNPDLKSDAVAAAFLARERPDTLVLWCNYDSNPWCSRDIRAEAEWCRQTDPETFSHVWHGQFRTHAAACILAGKFEVKDFDADAIERMPGCKRLFGLDFTSGGASPQ